MLQIISGKFFTSDDRHKFEAFGTLYSNVAAYRDVSTSVATLHRVDPHGSVAQYVITYTNQIQKEPDDRLVRTGDSEIIEQFRLLLMMGFRGFFATDRRAVEHACRTRPATAGDYVPSQIMDRFCDARINAKPEDFERLEELVRDVLGLRRKTYVAVMGYLRNFVHALEAADTNIDLAYSMLMYGIEALSQQFGAFEPTWDDYDAKVRTRIDALMSQDTELRDAVRHALLQSTPLRVQQRAAQFVEQHLPDDFFEGEELKTRKLPLRGSFVRRAIRNAYRLRSKFVHELERGKGIHSWGADFDTLTQEHEPLLTFRGLLRVADAVVRRFISLQERMDAETIDWRSELPNVMTVELASHYWIWRADSFQPNRAHTRLTAFLEQLEEAQSGGKITDLGALLKKIETLISSKSGSLSEQRAMACLYVLYHRLIGQSIEFGELAADEGVLARCGELLTPCTIESLVCAFLLGQEWSWSRDDCREAALSYSRQKFSTTSISLRGQMEAALFAALANMYRDEPVEEESVHFWIRNARLELVGHPEKQAYLRTCADEAVRVEPMRLIRAWSQAEPPPESVPETPHTPEAES